jgi:menaquinone-dependent protoporphyrinogen oxidase
MSKILVTAGSKHGATFEIAQSIYDTLQHRGHEVSLARPGDVGALAGFDAIVLGSSVYAGHWHKEAKDLARRIGEAAPRPAVWLFSSGPLGDSPKPEDDPADMVSILESTGARDHRVFAGKIDKAKLSFAERAIMTALHAPEGDFREWDQVTDWAEEIGAALETKAAPSH